MNRTSKLLIVFTLFALLAAAFPTLAQEDYYAITEAEINSTYAVTNPVRRTVSDVFVDLQSGQAVVSYTVTGRRGNTGDVEITMVPSVSNGRIFWSVTSGTLNGEPASEDLLEQINAVIESSWRTYFRTQAPVGRVDSVEITEDEIRIYPVGSFD